MTTSAPPAPGPTRSVPALTHRPALDGIRALAVVAVLLFHGAVGWARGGFLGVDLFFVLSGFLITSLLLDERRRTGRIALRPFWFRRARRLLPALFAVVLFVCLYAATLAPDVIRNRLRGDLLATLAYVANWRFIVEEVSYFERYAAPNPLLHMWSLAIEEQFYVLWPFLVLLLLSPVARRLGRSAFPIGVGLLAVASTVLMAVLYEPGTDPSRVYYGTDTRAATLLVGALAAWFVTRARWWSRPVTAPAPAWVGATAGAGLLGFLALVVLVDETSKWLYQGGFLLVALLCLTLVVPAVYPGHHPVSRLLSTRPLRAVGDRSYGLYLWHWPLYVVLTPERVGLEGSALLVLRLVVTAVVASLSFTLLEQPVRRWWPHGQGSPWTPRAVRRFLGAGLVCAAVAVVATPSGAASAGPEPASSAASGPTVFLLGDSVAYGLHTESPPAEDLGVRAAGLTALGCPVIADALLDNGSPQPTAKGCATWPQDWRAAVADSRPDVAVVMIGNGELFDHVADGVVVPFGTPEYRAHIEDWLNTTFADLAAPGRALAMTNVPCYDKPGTGLDGTAAIVNDPARQTWLNGVLADWSTRHPEVSLLDLRAAVCGPDGAYTNEVDGIELRRDGVHFTPAGAQYVWAWLAPQVRELSSAAPSASPSAAGG